MFPVAPVTGNRMFSSKEKGQTYRVIMSLSHAAHAQHYGRKNQL